MPTSADNDNVPGTNGPEPKRILLVDDDPEIVESLSYALKSQGYRILVARDGNQGLAMAEREDPDLVILDLRLPVLRLEPGGVRADSVNRLLREGQSSAG